MERQNQVQSLSETIPATLKLSTRANYDHIELTPDEIDEAIYKAKYEKDGRIKMEAYRNKLFSVPTFESLDYEKLDAFVREKYRVVDVKDQKLLNFYKNEKLKYFLLDDSNRDIYEMLCQYFSNDQSFEFNDEYSLKKGIMLRGPVGCGKTTLMQMFALNSFRPFDTISCRVIADHYSKNGSDALFSYSEKLSAYPQQNFGHKEIGRCFDDLGTENLKKNFGNEVNVMQDLIYKIYDNKTFAWFHLTTNLGLTDVVEYYGDRVKSRVFEMFNVISFPSTARDWRL